MTREIFFFKYHAENKGRRLVPDPFLFFIRALYQVKESGLQLSLNIFQWFLTWYTIQTM